MKQQYTILSLLLLLIAAVPASAQKKNTILFYPWFFTGESEKPTPVDRHNGFVVLNSGDTLYGTIKLDKKEMTLKDEKGQKQTLSYTALQHIRLNDADTLLQETAYTDYKRLNNQPKIWRLIATGKVNIYDESLYADEKAGHLGEEIVVQDQQQIHFVWSFWSWSRRADLLKFVNKRYNTTYRFRDFKTSKSLIDYLVAKG